MKKRYLFYVPLIALVGVIMVSCHEAPSGDTFAEDQYVPIGSLISASNVVTGFFDLGDPANSSIAFDLTAEGEAVSNADVMVSYNNGAVVPFKSTGVPGTVSATFDEILAATGLAESDMAVGDNFKFLFDGTSPSGTFRSSTSLDASVSCKSELAGTYDYVSTNLFATYGNPCPSEASGTVTFSEVSAGVYLCSDLGFGQYESSCWGDSPATSSNATFSDVCNVITSGGLDQYGLTYIWVITDVTGPNLSMSWSNDYADGGEVVITRPDGSDWPPLSSIN